MAYKNGVRVWGERIQHLWGLGCIELGAYSMEMRGFL